VRAFGNRGTYLPKECMLTFPRLLLKHHPFLPPSRSSSLQPVMEEYMLLRPDLMTLFL
jgi:hypothetical protein